MSPVCRLTRVPNTCYDALVTADSEGKAGSSSAPSAGAREVRLFDTRFHAVTLERACAIIFDWIRSADETCRFVVTPNVDHVVRVRSNVAQQAAYEAADLVVADGWPLVAVSRLFGSPLPERVAGSDLVPALMAKWDGPRPLRVFLLGAAPGVADTAAKNIVAECPSVEVCGTYSPPFGFEQLPWENERIVETVNAVRPDVIIVGFGAPKQEIWLHAHADRLRAQAAIAAGGTIDFLAGEQPRAPAWVRRIGMEWFHRLASDPRRLAGRYFYDAWVFPQLVAKECWRRVISKLHRS